MDYRALGTTDLRVSALGLACHTIGGGLYHRDDGESIRMLHQALDAGVNFFDVSDHHSQGHAERLIGQAFRGRRNRVILATKTGYRFAPVGTFALHMRSLLRPASALLRPWQRKLHHFKASQVRYDFSPEHIRQAVEASLVRLQTDHIDLYQLYKPSGSMVEAGDFLAVLERLKAEGKIRHWGLACATVEDTRPAFRHRGIASVQVAINLLDQDALSTLLPSAQQRGVGVVARYPRACGLLTSAGSDIMGDTSQYSEAEHARRVHRVQAFRGLVTSNRTLSQAAIQFVLQIPGVASAIPRAVTCKELAENLGALTAPPLSAEELGQIAALSEPGEWSRTG